MKCPKCRTELPDGAKFREGYCTELEVVFPSGNAGNCLDQDSCGECGHRVTSPEHSRPPKNVSFDEELAKIQKCLPRSLAEILLNPEREQSLGAGQWIEETAQCFVAAEAMIYTLRCSREEEMEQRQSDNLVKDTHLD
jgi:hypothetical protein